MGRLALALTLFAFALVGACSSEPARSRRLADRPKSLYALVSIAYDDSGTHGTFKAVVQYKTPGRIRITAFKDVVLLASGSVFDLLITPEVFALEVAARGDAPEVRDQGPTLELATRHPGFRGFGWAREELFLPEARVEAGYGAAGQSVSPVRVRFGSFRGAVPESITYRDEELGTRMEIRLLELEENPDLDDAIFRPDAVGAPPK